MFSVKYKWQPGKAAGVAMKFKVYFHCKEFRDYEDYFKVTLESGEKKKIKIFAYKPKAILVFEPFVDVGFAQVGKEKRYDM